MIRLHPDELERRAHKRAGAKLGWYIHAVVYVLMNMVIFAVSQYGFGSRPWSAVPLLAWGLGLTLHGISVFALGPDGRMHEPLVRRERDRMQREHDGS